MRTIRVYRQWVIYVHGGKLIEHHGTMVTSGKDAHTTRVTIWEAVPYMSGRGVVRGRWMGGSREVLECARRDRNHVRLG